MDIINSSLYNFGTGNINSDNIKIDQYIINKYLHYKEGGIFIEAGGFDGLFQSNTFVLEKYLNWTGILVEPSYNQYEKCKKNRSCNIYNRALVSFDYNKEFINGDFEDSSPMSSINGERRGYKQLIQVKVSTLQSILDELNITRVNFFSLDVEGYELSVLKGIDFNKVKFDLILVEFNPANLDELLYFMIEHNYEFIENVSNYRKETNPGWDGLHNDYLFGYCNIVIFNIYYCTY
jgi:FkbM family methyltransferase